jgi:hypothetical protein
MDQTLYKFNFVIKHIRVSQNQIADTLNRDCYKITSQSKIKNQNKSLY